MQPKRYPVLMMVLFALIMTTSTLAEHTKNQPGKVDLVLVLALDVSSSIDAADFKLMTTGLARALATPQIEKAILSGRLGVIAICVIQWSGFVEQAVTIGWTCVAHLRELRNLAGKISRMPRRYRDGATDIGTAIKFSRKAIASAPFDADRRVIDIAGDGTNNVNASPIFQRDITVRAGITINGLAVPHKSPALVEYYTSFVIGGDGAFAESAPDYAGFERAMQRKLLREISSNHLF